MKLYPAIDLIGGRCVRLTQGDYNRVDEYNPDPVAQSLAFRAMGAEALHVVDLDGAKAGCPVNLGVIAAIARAVRGLPPRAVPARDRSLRLSGLEPLVAS